MKKIIFAGAVAAMMLPAAAFAQDADVQMNQTTGAAGGVQTEGGAMATPGASMETTGSTTADVEPGGAMGAGATSATSDTTGSYTIITKTSAENAGTTSGQDANRNTDPMAVQRTIEANPGLAEKLQAEGITMDQIGSISVGTNGEVTIFSKS